MGQDDVGYAITENFVHVLFQLHFTLMFFGRISGEKTPRRMARPPGIRSARRRNGVRTPNSLDAGRVADDFSQGSRIRPLKSTLL